VRCVVCDGGLRAAVRDAAGYTLELHTLSDARNPLHRKEKRKHEIRQRGPRRDAQPLHATPLAAVLFPAPLRAPVSFFFHKKENIKFYRLGCLSRPQSWGMWPFAEQEEADSNTRAVALAAIALGLAISSFLYLCQRQPATASPTKPSQPSQTAPTRSRSPARSKLSKAGAATPRALKGLEIDMAMPASGGSRTRRRAA